MPPARDLAMLHGQFSPYLNLGLFDPPLAAPQPDWPPNTHVTGAPLHDGTLSPQVRDELDTFLQAGDPPLVFALGSSAVWVAGDFWRHAVAASRAFGYLPYSMVFPRAAAVVHQAGIGTLSQALRAGRPQLIVPFAFDQPDNALRASRLGLARVLPLKKLDASSLRRELDALLSAKDYEHRASRVARELRDVNGAERAAQELSTLMESR